MEPAKAPGQRRTVSYADAVKGHKAPAGKPRLSAGGDDKIEASPMPKKPEKPEVIKAAQKAAQKKLAKSDAEGAPVGNQGRPPQVSQVVMDHGRESADPNTQEHTKQSATWSLSYAEAVKGKRSLTIRGPKGTGHGEGAKMESPQPGQTRPSAEKPGVAKPARAEFPKLEARQGEFRHHEAKQSHLEGAERHPCGERTRPCSSAPLLSDNKRRHERSDDSVAGATELAQTGDDHGVELYSPSHHPFSAGAVSSPSVHPFSNASSPPTRASAPPDLPITQHSPNDVRNNIISMSDHIDQARLHQLIAAHDRGDVSLWYTQEAWDVEIVCQGTTWRLHRDILCQHSDWFRQRLRRPLPLDPSIVRVQLFMNDHQPEQLSQALYWIYNRRFQSGTTAVDPDRLSGEPIRSCVFSCISAASIGCGLMFASALYDLDYATYVLPGALQAYDPGADIRDIYEPLFDALSMLYEQDPQPGLLPLRAKMAHFLDRTLIGLLRNDSLRMAFVDKWVHRLYGHMAEEHKFFSHQGTLLVLQEEHADRWGLLVVNDQPTYQDWVSGNPERRIPEEINYVLCVADSLVRSRALALASIQRHTEVRQQLAAEREAMQQKREARFLQHRQANGLSSVPVQSRNSSEQCGEAEPLSNRLDFESFEDLETFRSEEEHFYRLAADFNRSLDEMERGSQIIRDPSAPGQPSTPAPTAGTRSPEIKEEGQTTTDACTSVGGRGGSSSPRDTDASTSVGGQGGNSPPRSRKRGRGDSRDDSRDCAEGESSTGRESPFFLARRAKERCGESSRSASGGSAASATASSAASVSGGSAAASATASPAAVRGEGGARASWWRAVMSEEED